MKRRQKLQRLPRMEGNTLLLKEPVNMGETETVNKIEFKPEMTAEAMNLMKADHSSMTYAEVLLVTSKLCDQNPNFLINWLGAPDKRFIVDYTLFLVLAAG